MRLKTILNSLLLSSLVVSFVACDDEAEGFNVVDGSVNMTAVDTLVVNENTMFELDGQLNPTDKVVAVRSGKSIYLDWGYSYDSTDENGVLHYDGNKAFAKVVFDDKWEYGDWTIYAENGNERRKIGDIVMVVLDTKQHKPLVTTDLFRGVISVAADGWAANIDNFEFYNKELQDTVVVSPSSFTDANPDFNYSEVTFETGELPTGNYTLRVRRWNYDFVQDLGDFYYFRNSLVDTLDITTVQDPASEYNGRYYIDMYLDEIIEGDKVRVTYDTGKTSYFDSTLEQQYFIDEENHIYRIYIPEKKVYPGKSYYVTLIRDGYRVRLAGEKLLPEESEES